MKTTYQKSEALKMNIEKRLESLEKKYIRLKRIAGSLCLFGLLFFLVAASNPNNEIITAKAFVVLDNEGNIRQVFGPNLRTMIGRRLGKETLEEYRNYINTSDDKRFIGKSYGMEVFNKKGVVKAEIRNIPHNKKKKRNRFNKDRTYIRLYDEEKVQMGFMKPYFSVGNVSANPKIILTKTHSIYGNQVNATLETGHHHSRLSLSTTPRIKGEDRGKNNEKYSTLISAGPVRGGLRMEYGDNDMAGLEFNILAGVNSKQPEVDFFIKDYLTTSKINLSMNNSTPSLDLVARNGSRKKYYEESEAARKLIKNGEELNKQQSIIFKKYHSGANQIRLNSKRDKGPTVELWKNGVERIHLGSTILKRGDGSSIPRTSTSIALFNESSHVVKLIP